MMNGLFKIVEMPCDGNGNACFRARCDTSGCVKNAKNDTKPETETSAGKTHDLSAAHVAGDDKTIKIHVGAPGVHRSDIKVTQLDDNVLSVRGESKGASGDVFKVEQ